jgi:hypothetical protein
MPRTKDIGKLIQLFCGAMRQRFNEVEQAGWEGWNSKAEMVRMKPIKERIIKNVLERDWVDVANLAMMAWNLDL